MPGHVRSLWTERPIERRTRAIRTITLRGATAISFRKTFPTCCAENAGKAVDVELILVVVYQFLDLLIESCRARSFGQAPRERKLTAVFGNYLNRAMVASRPDTYDSARP
jgi:hypothetical protein